MRTEWDCPKLAEAYLKRPDYSNSAIEAMTKIMSVTSEMSACDIGAGVAHLTLKLQPKFSKIDAVEPNDQMREIDLKEQSLQILNGLRVQAKILH